jgi:hypothetical protein
MYTHLNKCYLTLVLILSVFVSCTPGTKSSDPKIGGATQAKALGEGVLLAGADSQRAVDAIVDYSQEGPESDGSMPDSGDDSSPRPHKLSITLTMTATVGQVNALLNQQQARIVWSAKKSPNLEIRLPETSNLESSLEFLKKQKDVISFAVIVEE